MRLVDRFLAQSEFAPLQRDLRVVDVGYGDSLVSTTELARFLLPLCEHLQLTAVENDPLRVRSGAREHADLPLTIAESISVRQGGFALHELGLEGLHLVRCFNVLRGYGKEDAENAQRLLCSQLLDGGLLIEGTSDTEGHQLGCHLWQRQNHHLVYGGLLLATDFARGFSPRMFRDVLPRDLRRSCFPGEPVFTLLARWEEEVSRIRQRQGKSKRNATALWMNQVFASSIAELSADPELPLSYIALPPETPEDRRAPGAAVLWRPQKPSHSNWNSSPNDPGHEGGFSFRFPGSTRGQVLR